MKAVVITRGGLELQDVPAPTPKHDEVRVRVHAATVTTGDVVLRSLWFTPLFWFPIRKLLGMPPRKRTPGHEFAGVVDSIGAGVTKFKAGDEVFGTTTGLVAGANAELVCVPESRETGVLAAKPANLTFEEAAAIPVGAMTALFFLKQGGLREEKRVLVYGASGSVGTYAVQLAKAFGAEVTAVCSTANVELVRSLGADRIIDYTRQDYTQAGGSYDIVFDAVGKTSRDRAATVLDTDGQFVTVQGKTAHEQIDAFGFLSVLIEAGKLRPVIDRCFSLEQIHQAYDYVKTGRKRGNVVIQVSTSASPSLE